MNIIGKTISAIAVSLCIGASVYSPEALAGSCGAERENVDRAYNAYSHASAKYGPMSREAKSAFNTFMAAQSRLAMCQVASIV